MVILVTAAMLKMWLSYSRMVGHKTKKATIDAATAAKNAGIHIITIGIGNPNWIDQWELRTISSHPYTYNYITVRYFRDLMGIRTRLRNIICDTTDECRSNPCRNGGQCRHGYGYYVCLCPARYAGRQCEIRCEKPVDLVFALDGSGSIGKPNFLKEVAFTRDLVMGLNLNRDSRIGAEVFSNAGSISFYLNTYSSKYNVLNGMSFFYPGGSTNTADAISKMRTVMFTSTYGDRSGVPNVGVVISDGRSNNERNTWAQAMQARARGIHMIAVGVGNNIRRLELEGIASSPTSRNVFRVGNFDGFNSITNNLLRAICNNNNECGSNPCRNGGRCIEGIQGYTCDCRSGYTGVNCERSCDGRADVVFVIDASGSIRNNRFVDILRFITDIVSRMEVGSSKTRIGVIKLSDNPSIQFHLNRYTAKQDVIAHINHITFVNGRTNIASAIQQVRTQMFTSGRGARTAAPNFMILVTDGNANINAARTLPEAVAARNSGIHIIVVSVGTMVNTHNINNIASLPVTKNIFTVRNYAGLRGIVDNVVRATCNDQNECRSNPCQSGGNCVDGLGRYICRCPRGRAGERCEKRCDRQVDVTFVLDLSGSVQSVTKLTIDFTRRVIHGLDIDNGQVRVGLISFTNRASVAFYLNTYNTKLAVINAVVFPKTIVKGTNTQEALNLLRTQVLESNRGDRSGVPNRAVVITDGNSNIQQFNTGPAAQNARRETRIFAVGVGTSVNTNELNAIASDPDSTNVLMLPNANSLNSVADTLLNRLCQ